MLLLSHSIIDITHGTYNFSLLKNCLPQLFPQEVTALYVHAIFSVYFYSIFTSICCLFLDGSHSDKETLKSQHIVDFNAHVVITLGISKIFSCKLFHHMILTKLIFLYYFPSWIISSVLHILRILNAQI